VIDFEQRAMDYLATDPRRRTGETLEMFLRNVAIEVLLGALVLAEASSAKARELYGTAESVGADMTARAIRNEIRELAEDHPLDGLTENARQEVRRIRMEVAS
jgi:hypothetical protein